MRSCANGCGGIVVKVIGNGDHGNAGGLGVGAEAFKIRLALGHGPRAARTKGRLGLGAIGENHHEFLGFLVVIAYALVEHVIVRQHLKAEFHAKGDMGPGIGVIISSRDFRLGEIIGQRPHDEIIADIAAAAPEWSGACG